MVIVLEYIRLEWSDRCMIPCLLPIDFHDLLDSKLGRVAIILSHRFVVTCRRLSIGLLSQIAVRTASMHFIQVWCAVSSRASTRPLLRLLEGRVQWCSMYDHSMDIGRQHVERLTSTSVLSNYKMNLELLVYAEFLQLKVVFLPCESTRSKTFSRDKAGEPTSIRVLSEVCTIILVNCWLMCVMMGSAILVADVVKEVCIGAHPWQCWLASFLYVVDLEMLRTCKSVSDWGRTWCKITQVTFTEIIWDHWRLRSNIYQNLSSNCLGDVFRNLAPREPWQEVTILTFC